MATKKKPAKKSTNKPQKDPGMMMQEAMQMVKAMQPLLAPQPIWAPLLGKQVILTSRDDEAVQGVLEAIQGGLCRLNVDGKYALIVLETVTSIFEAPVAATTNGEQVFPPEAADEGVPAGADV